MRYRSALGIALFTPYVAVFYPLIAARRAAAALSPRGAWRTWVSSHILLGGFLVPQDVPELHRLGIRAVVNVSHELWDPALALRAAGIEYLRVPCWDTRAPTLDEAARGVQFIHRHIAAGRRVYIHCASGVGRSVVLALCYLATQGGLDAEQALTVVKLRRPRVALRPAQRAFVDRYVAWHRARSEAGTRARATRLISDAGGT